MNTTFLRPESGATYWRVAVIAVAAAATLALTACAGMSHREASTVVGATAGAVIGGAVTGTTAGAALGAAAGGVVGNEVSKKRDR
ncbi:glycine zipper domain-containing protein [Roseateles sp. BYS78W]|uniref:Glycine zipper domain-containing protein n=1 Tax=Pelomonas candidula TaxID=3299025 RepID=A0ABW7H9W7_9BURK